MADLFEDITFGIACLIALMFAIPVTFLLWSMTFGLLFGTVGSTLGAVVLSLGLAALECLAITAVLVPVMMAVVWIGIIFAAFSLFTGGNNGHAPHSAYGKGGAEEGNFFMSLLHFFLRDSGDKLRMLTGNEENATLADETLDAANDEASYEQMGELFSDGADDAAGVGQFLTDAPANAEVSTKAEPTPPGKLQQLNYYLRWGGKAYDDRFGDDHEQDNAQSDAQEAALNVPAASM